jgi:hypothetical protein
MTVFFFLSFLARVGFLVTEEGGGTVGVVVKVTMMMAAMISDGY